MFSTSIMAGGSRSRVTVIRHTSVMYFVPRPHTARDGNGRGGPNGSRSPEVAMCVSKNVPVHIKMY